MSNGMKVMDLDNIRNQKAPTLIMGLIPAQNRFYLDIVWPIMLPGLQKLEKQSRGEWNIFRVWKEIYAGTMQLYMAYMERDLEDVPESKYQEIAVDKLKTPQKDYVGFTIIQLFDHCVHIFAAHVTEEFNRTNVMALGLKFIEGQAKALGAPYLQAITQPDGDGIPCTTQGWMERMGYEHSCTVYRKKL